MVEQFEVMQHNDKSCEGLNNPKKSLELLGAPF